MMQKIKEFLSFNLTGLLNSYSQIFFSSNAVFACILILVTFFDFWAGLGGLFCILVSNGLAWGIGLNKYTIKSGAYGFNSLLVGLGIAVYYQPSPELYVLIFFASLLTLFFSVMLSGVIGKYGLPFLSTSFLLAIWLVTISSRQFKSLAISERGIYTLNEMYAWGGIPIIKAYNWINNLGMHESVTIYLKSLGGIFFQYHIFAGILIALGILIYSRIAFLLSIVGFFSAYLYYIYIGANIDELSYSFIGFNFILTAIALGGYFIIPSKRSFLWVILLTPLISFFITSFSEIFGIIQLSIYSLPFNAIVILFLYVLKFRERGLTKPEVVYLQQNSPEKNLYSQINNLERFKNQKYFQFNLPFSGDWMVTQGHNGEFTHKDDWRHAWDFEIEDENRKLFHNSGYLVEDYYCYGKPVLAPADGVVEEIIDGVDDNEIGNSDIAHNWGNTIIIHHGFALYSKISHIKQGSFKVYKGAIVKKGDVIAACGSSGRSPQPHAHFQLQTTPYIGSKTLDYPISNYILHHDNGKLEYKTFTKPNKGDKISNIKRDDTLFKAFSFVPGQELSFSIVDENTGKQSIESWEIQVDMYNNTYILNKTNNAKAYFKSENSVFYFTHYEGRKKGLLFYFYLGAYKLISGYYQGLEITDNYPLNILNKNIFILVQDFFAPFYIFLRSKYRVKYVKKSEYFNESTIKLAAETEVNIFNFTLRKINFEFTIDKNRIEQFIITQNGKKISATWLESKLY